MPAFEQSGDLYLELERPSDALDAYESALYAAPRRFRSLIGAARAAAAIGTDDTATAYYRQLLSLMAETSERAAADEARRHLAGLQH